MNYESKSPLNIITPNDGYHYFFGYYDLQPFDKNSEKHLTHRVAFADHIPEIGEKCEIGYITIKDKVFHKVGETNAWNFQQGALLQWFDEENVIYNDFKNGKFCSVIKNINDGSERIICAPLAHLSQDRKWGLSINFARVWDFRPGYGYCNLKDEYYNENAPETDGVFLVDIEKNTSKLVINYKQLAELFPEKPFSDMKLLVNHITFNPSGSRFLILLRNFAKEGERWGTLLVTSGREGNDIRALSGYEINSHYHWKNDEEIIIYGGYPDWGIYFISDKTGKKVKLDDDLCNYDDIHCIYSPDRKCFIGDGYPNTGNSRYIILHDLKSKKSRAIVKVYSHPVSNTDIRCDLHNRFNPDGAKVSFDSYHTDMRQICLFDFDRKKLIK